MLCFGLVELLPPPNLPSTERAASTWRSSLTRFVLVALNSDTTPASPARFAMNSPSAPRHTALPRNPEDSAAIAERRALSLVARFKDSSAAPQALHPVVLDSHARPQEAFRPASQRQGKVPAGQAHHGTKDSRIGSASQPGCFLPFAGRTGSCYKF
jgi:hypothetical protein